jgi:hypothetical protein
MTDEETLYQLAAGLFPVRLEPGKPLVVGREGSPLLIELWVRERQGMNALFVYDPSGTRPAADAVAHALQPLADLAGEPFDAPPGAPPSAWAFRWREERSVSAKGA